MTQLPINILLVDDDEDDLFFARRALAKIDMLHRVFSVHDGLELMNYLQHKGEFNEQNAPKPDLILLDLNMPKMNGKEALKLIRENKELAHLPVLIFTTSGAETDIQTTYKLGANSYIKKPGDFTGLVEVMKVLKEYWVEHASLPPRNMAYYS